MPRTKVTARKFLGNHNPTKKLTPPPTKRRMGGTPPQGNVMKKRRYRPGTVSLREIRKYQTSTDLLIPKLAFQRLVKEMIQDECRERDIPTKKIQSPAILTLQCVCEDYVTELFNMSQRTAIHAKRITVIPDDIKIVMDLRGDYKKFNKPAGYTFE